MGLNLGEGLVLDKENARELIEHRDSVVKNLTSPQKKLLLHGPNRAPGYPASGSAHSAWLRPARGLARLKLIKWDESRSRFERTSFGGEVVRVLVLKKGER